MSDFDDLELFIKYQLPSFIREDHSAFVDFMEAYYEWLSNEGNAHKVIFDHANNIDVDKTSDNFLKHIKAKLFANIPEDVLVDKRLLAKNIDDFYGAKGSEKSYKFLFRILFNKNVNITYPSDFILKTSDGKWVRDQLLFVRNTGDDPFLFAGQTITGQTSGSVADIDVVKLFREQTIDSYNLIVNEFTGEFTIGETVSTTLADGTVVEAEIMGFVSEIEVLEEGLNYDVGDFVNINDLTGNGVNALGRITETFNPGVITSITIDDGGSGYRVGDPLIFDNTDTNGFGAIAEVSTISNDDTFETSLKIIAEEQNTVIDDIKAIVIEDFLNLTTFNTGAITGIDIIDGGENYTELPIVTVGQQVPSYDIPAGTGAELTPSTDAAGAISKIKVVNPGVGYIQHETQPTADLLTLGDGNATAKVYVSGGPFISDGRWLNLDGRLSSLMVIQDGDYYQPYSYVVNIDENLTAYSKVLKEVLHPAGMKFFGSIDIIQKINAFSETAGEALETNKSQYILNINKEMLSKVSLPDDFVSVLTDTPILAADKIIIFDFSNEIINDYKDIVLEDFMGFNGEKGNFTRRSVIEIV